MMRVVTFKLDEYTLERLDMAARRLRKYRSELIREAIQKLLDTLQDTGVLPSKPKIIRIRG